MKQLNHLYILVACLLMSTPSLASEALRDTASSEFAPSNTLRSKSRRSRTPKKFGFNFYTFFSSAEGLSTTRNSDYTSTNFRNANATTYAVPVAALTGEYSTSSAMGIGAEYAKPRIFRAGSFKFGMSGGATYEFDRTINRNLIRNTAINTDARSLNNRIINDTASDPSLSLLLPYINFTVTRRASYVFTGVSYSMPEMSDAGKEDYNGDIGYQVGFGTRINHWMAIEAAYRVVNFSASPNFDDLLTTGNRNFNLNNIEIENRRGLGIFSDEDLSLSGFTLSLRISI